MEVSDLKNKNVHIVGVSGAEGSAIVSFLFDQRVKKITAHDFGEEKDFQKNFNSFHDWMTSKEKIKRFRRLKNLPIKFKFGRKYLDGILGADIIFVPQSWFRYDANKKLFDAKKRKIEFSSITKLYFQLCPCPIIGITGTSGKSTTSRLIYEIFKASPIKTYFSGNDRENIQVLDQIFKINSNDILILEISNRQLMINLKKSPHIGVITNISPNHIDDHGNYENYIAVKKKLLSYQKSSDYAVLNGDNKETYQMSKECRGKSFLFSRLKELKEGAFLKGNNIVVKKDDREYQICSVKDLKILGPHNIENVLASVLVAFLFGINTKIIREAVMNFEGLKSRIELVREFRGVKYYEDSSGCNPDSPRVAVQSFSQPKILIAGGSRRKPIEGEFDSMAEAILQNNVKAVFLIGEMAEVIGESIKQAEKIRSQKIRKFWDFKPPIIKKCMGLEEAIREAKNFASRGDVVILSPGCESFGMFKDYRDRAKKFKSLVNRLR